MATEVSRRKVRLQDAQNFELTLVTYDDGSVGILSGGSGTGSVALDAATLAALETVTSNQGAAGASAWLVGSSDDTIITALTVDTAIYAAKDVIGGKITLANAVRAAGTTSILHSLMLMDRSGQKPTGFIIVFNADPTAATITDNAAFVSSTDDAKIIAQIPVTSGDWATPGTTKSFANIRNIGALVEPASGTSLYAAFVTDGTPDFVATTDVQLIWGFLR